ncbi:hypothetical protein MMC17_004993 [Xylographa soralifera]|nr:hypothetical protein [Xylographa soralifera]
MSVRLTECTAVVKIDIHANIPCVIFHNGKEEKGARSNENQASEKVAETDGDEHVAPKATFVLSTTRPIFVLQEASEPLEFPPSGTSDIGWEEWDSLVASNIPSLVEESSDRGEPPHNSLQSVVPPSPSTKPAPSETDLGDNSVYRINATGRSTYCTYCRRRELRCDGRKPKCSTCSNLGSACVYQDQKAPDRLTRCCAYCRIRLLRCDGRAPSCSTCSTLGHECVYDEANYRLPETPQTLNGSKEMSENPPLKGLEHKRAKNIKRGPVLVNQLANSQRPDLAAEAGEKPSEDAHSGTVGEINPTRADHILEDFSDDGR